MNVKFDGGFSISTDGTSFQLMKTVVVGQPAKDGSVRNIKQAKPENIGLEREKVLGCYPTFPQALTGLLRHGLAGSGVSTVEDLQAYLAVLNESIEQLPKILPRHVVELAQAEQQLASLRAQLAAERKAAQLPGGGA